MWSLRVGMKEGSVKWDTRTILRKPCVLSSSHGERAVQAERWLLPCGRTMKRKMKTRRKMNQTNKITRKKTSAIKTKNNENEKRTNKKNKKKETRHEPLAPFSSNVIRSSTLRAALCPPLRGNPSLSRAAGCRQLGWPGRDFPCSARRRPWARKPEHWPTSWIAACSGNNDVTYILKKRAITFHTPVR